MKSEQSPKIAPDVIWRLLDDNAVVVSPKGGKVRVLNGLGTEIWKMLTEDASPRAIEAYIVDQYEVSPEQAYKDLKQFLQELSERGLIVW